MRPDTLPTAPADETPEDTGELLLRVQASMALFDDQLAATRRLRTFLQRQVGAFVGRSKPVPPKA